MKLCPEITVAGIAGPGDTLATDYALGTFKLIKEHFPNLIKCMSTNGLLLYERAEEIIEVGIDSLTVTVNAVDPKIEAKLNKYIIYHGEKIEGTRAAKILIENQLKGIKRIAEVGIEVVWALAWHYDKKYENGDVPPSMEYLLKNDIDFEASVADQQNYEVMNILKKYQPDLYLSRHPGSTVWAIKNGTPAVYVDDEYKIFGYKHTLEFARNVLNSIHNRSFEQNLAKRVKQPYTDWWYKQSVDKFLERSGK